VHGHPAVGVSLPEMTIVSMDGSPAQEWDLDSITAADRESMRAVLARMEDFIPGLAARRSAIRIESRLARGAGFGSSAALCGAIARAALAHAGLGVEARPDEAWRLAHSAENIFHGTSSGIDTGLALMGGTCVFLPHPPALPACERLEHPPIWLVVGAVPRDAACGELVGALSRRLSAGDVAVRTRIEALGGLAAAAAAVLRAGGGDAARRIGHLADDAMGHLRDLALSTPALEKVLDTGRAAGALGGKLSGAGAGGAFYLVAEDEASARSLAAHVQKDCQSAGFVSPVRVLVVGAGNS
jgi:mevalonate kinase